VGQRHKNFPLAALGVAIIDPVPKSLLGKDGSAYGVSAKAFTRSLIYLYKCWAKNGNVSLMVEVNYSSVRCHLVSNIIGLTNCERDDRQGRIFCCARCELATIRNE
jgi:hypothetical protein